MRVASIQTAQHVHSTQQSRTKNNQSKMQINTGCLNNAGMQKSYSPSFGWFLLDDMFFYFNRKLNESREAQKREQISTTNEKVVDDISLLAKKLHVSPAIARERYNEYLKIGGIKPIGYGNEEGLNKVIGYCGEKLDLIQHVVAPIISAQQAESKYSEHRPSEFDVPNGVILYGPRGRGKSFMAECLMEHFKEKSRDSLMGIYTINRPWKEGDTLENALAIVNTFENAKKQYERTKERSVIYIEEFDKMLNENKNPILCAEFYNAAKECNKKGITWVGTITSPKAMPDWLFDPDISNVTMPVKKISEVEQSAVMSYFWAKHNRLDKSDHDAILNYMRNNDIAIYPPQFEEISKNVNEKLSFKDYSSKKRGNYKAPVTTEDVKAGIIEYKTIKEMGDKQNKKDEERKELMGLDDADYISKVKEQYYGNKLR